jgi:hypothetical protein
MFTYGVATTVTFVATLRVHPMPWTSALASLEEARLAN